MLSEYTLSELLVLVICAAILSAMVIAIFMHLTTPKRIQPWRLHL